MVSTNIGGSSERVEGLQPPFWEVFKLVWLPMSVPFSYEKNIIISIVLCDSRWTDHHLGKNKPF